MSAFDFSKCSLADTLKCLRERCLSPGARSPSCVLAAVAASDCCTKSPLKNEAFRACLRWLAQFPRSQEHDQLLDSADLALSLELGALAGEADSRLLYDRADELLPAYEVLGVRRDELVAAVAWGSLPLFRARGLESVFRARFPAAALLFFRFSCKVAARLSAACFAGEALCVPRVTAAHPAETALPPAPHARSEPLFIPGEVVAVLSDVLRPWGSPVLCRLAELLPAPLLRSAANRACANALKVAWARARARDPGCREFEAALFGRLFRVRVDLAGEMPALTDPAQVRCLGRVLGREAETPRVEGARLQYARDFERDREARGFSCFNRVKYAELQRLRCLDFSRAGLLLPYFRRSRHMAGGVCARSPDALAIIVRPGYWRIAWTARLEGRLVVTRLRYVEAGNLRKLHEAVLEVLPVAGPALAGL